MKYVFSLGLAAAFALSSGVVFAQSDAMSSAGSVTVTMHAQNGSGEDGTATLKQDGNDLVISISLKNGSSTAQPAHVHEGSCPKPTGVKYPLSNVVDGKSTSTLKGITLTSLETGGFSINVHKSADDLATYVSCGDIPKS